MVRSGDGSRARTNRFECVVDVVGVGDIDDV